MAGRRQAGHHQVGQADVSDIDLNATPAKGARRAGTYTTARLDRLDRIEIALTAKKVVVLQSSGTVASGPIESGFS